VRIHSDHRRELGISVERAGALLESLAGPDDRLWSDRWPALRLDRGLAVGSRGGHGPIRYTVVRHTPGRDVVFRFRRMAGLRGEHGFHVSETGDGHAVLQHLTEAEGRGPWLLLWPLVIRPLHDAAVTDCLDRAEGLSPRALRGRPRALVAALAALRRLGARGSARGGAALRPAARPGRR
jgi:hypothetical protein